ncbi:hypothetical protein Droror1_Dr00022885 [Drosera rotundifolia]
MLSFKIIQTSSINPTRSSSTPSRFSSNRHGLVVVSCRSSKWKNSSDSSDHPQKGDPRKQELLAQIVMLETEKVRLTEYMDDRAAYLTQFVKEAKDEIDAIGEDALRGLDRASARITERMDSQMKEYEESSRRNRLKMAKRDKEIADFENEYESLKNEGMFFKSLGRERTPPVRLAKAAAREEAKKIQELTIDISTTSKIRKSLYLMFIGIVTTGVADSLVSDSPDWRKTAVLSAILVSLLSQLAYEQRILPLLESDELEKKKRIAAGKKKDEEGK